MLKASKMFHIFAKLCTFNTNLKFIAGKYEYSFMGSSKHRAPQKVVALKGMKYYHQELTGEELDLIRILGVAKRYIAVAADEAIHKNLP
eukprot:snap_masked-scaffold_5-processed-gene-16.62-mRNA-1 protein AED:1.00 eAED:1.00 QI:0/-1/0/0/-1/1/1/0/88